MRRRYRHRRGLDDAIEGDGVLSFRTAPSKNDMKTNLLIKYYRYRTETTTDDLNRKTPVVKYILFA